MGVLMIDVNGNVKGSSVKMNEDILFCEKLTDLAKHNRSEFLHDFKQAFFEIYGKTNTEVVFFASPARVNIIGEHIDYNGGLVFPAAIDTYLYLAIRKRNDNAILYNDIRFPGEKKFSITDSFAYKKEDEYANYLNGILKIMKDAGYVFDSGFEILLFSTIPAGGGISSSSALEVGFAYAISETFHFDIDRITIAKMGQQSEHDFMNVKCGIMDQFIIAVGKKDHAIVLDTQSLEYRFVPLQLNDYRIVVMNSNKKRQLADSKYNERRSECEKGLAILQKNISEKAVLDRKIEALCELEVFEFEKIKTIWEDSLIQNRVKHCVYENDRVKKAVTALENNDLSELGQLLCQSHESLRDDYEVTGIELDSLYEEAIKNEGCLGARMTGAGFGGCAIALVHTDFIDRFISNVGEAYTLKTGLCATFFACMAGDGVSKLI